MKKRWIFCAISIIVFMFLFVNVVLNHSIFFDASVMNFVYSMRNDTLTKICKFISLFGEAKIIIVVVVLLSGYLFFIKKDKRNAILNFFNIANVAVLNQGVKHLVKRSRPTSMLIEETGYSFPSGHSMVSMGFYGLLIYMIIKSNMKKNIKILLTSLLCILILLIGFSRIYLGVHYPSDILAGYTITLSYLIIFITLFNKKIKNTK